jgi:hypothetical protein
MTNDLITRRDELAVQVETARTKLESANARKSAAQAAYNAHGAKGSGELLRELSAAKGAFNTASIEVRDLEGALRPINDQLEAPGVRAQADAELARLEAEAGGIAAEIRANAERSAELRQRAEALAPKVESAKAKASAALIAGTAVDLTTGAKLSLELDAVGEARQTLEATCRRLEADREANHQAQREARETRRAAEGILIRPEAREALAGVADVLVEFIGHHGRAELADLLDSVLDDAEAREDDALVIRQAGALDLRHNYGTTPPSKDWPALRDVVPRSRRGC